MLLSIRAALTSPLHPLQVVSRGLRVVQAWPAVREIRRGITIPTWHRLIEGRLHFTTCLQVVLHPNFLYLILSYLNQSHSSGPHAGHFHTPAASLRPSHSLPYLPLISRTGSDSDHTALTIGEASSFQPASQPSSHPNPQPQPLPQSTHFPICLICLEMLTPEDFHSGEAIRYCSSLLS